jgi:hypothetical protein
MWHDAGGGRGGQTRSWQVQGIALPSSSRTIWRVFTAHSSSGWAHEIKRDGYPLIVPRDSEIVRQTLISASA